MLFEHALYYPTIDIKDEAWLKSAVLLWDTISVRLSQIVNISLTNMTGVGL